MQSSLKKQEVCEVEIVRDFLEVFPDEFPGVLPDW